MRLTRGFHPRRRARLTQVGTSSRQGGSGAGCILRKREPTQVSEQALVAMDFHGFSNEFVREFVAQHFRQCPARWSLGQQLETPVRDGATHQALLWVASKCIGGSLHTIVFAPGEEPF
jgi:hypothetical protein